MNGFARARARGQSPASTSSSDRLPATAPARPLCIVPTRFEHLPARLAEEGTIWRSARPKFSPRFQRRSAGISSFGSPAIGGLPLRRGRPVARHLCGHSNHRPSAPLSSAPLTRVAIGESAVTIHRPGGIPSPLLTRRSDSFAVAQALRTRQQNRRDAPPHRGCRSAREGVAHIDPGESPRRQRIHQPELRYIPPCRGGFADAEIIKA